MLRGEDVIGVKDIVAVIGEKKSSLSDSTGIRGYIRDSLP
jgi:hypothetical protein